MKSKFFCDINGTFTSVGSKKSREELLNEFVLLLSKLENNEIEFSFVSGENIFTVLSFITEIKNALDKHNLNISLGFHYSSEKIYKRGLIEPSNSGKIGQIGEDLRDNNYETIYFADDSKIVCGLIESILSSLAPQSKIVIFNPKDNNLSGLESLNKEINDYEERIVLSKTKKDGMTKVD